MCDADFFFRTISEGYTSDNATIVAPVVVFFDIEVFWCFFDFCVAEDVTIAVFVYVAVDVSDHFVVYCRGFAVVVDIATHGYRIGVGLVVINGHIRTADIVSCQFVVGNQTFNNGRFVDCDDFHVAAEAIAITSRGQVLSRSLDHNHAVFHEAFVGVDREADTRLV